MKKGAISGNVPMVILIIFSVLLAFQGYRSSDALGNEVSKSFSDLSDLSNTMKTTDIFFYSYLRDAAMFSVNQVTYNIARNGGGLKWNGSTIHNISIDHFHRKADKNTHQYFLDSYSVEEYTTTACDISNDDFNIYQPSLATSLGTKYLAQDVTSDLSNFEMTCSFRGSSTTYRATENEVSAKYNASGNRFYQQASATIDYFNELDGILESSRTDFYYNPSDSRFSSCNDVTESEAEDEVLSEAVSQFEQYASSAESRAYQPEGLSIDAGLKSSYMEDGLKVEELDTDSFSEDCGCERERYEVACPDDGDDDGGDDDGGDDRDWCFGYGCVTAFFYRDSYNEIDTCYDTRVVDCKDNGEDLHSASVEIDDAQYEYEMTDQNFKIPVEEGFKRLKFIVDEFTHSLESRGNSIGTEFSIVKVVNNAEELTMEYSPESEIINWESAEGSSSVEEPETEMTGRYNEISINSEIRKLTVKTRCPIGEFSNQNQQDIKFYVNGERIESGEISNYRDCGERKLRDRISVRGIEEGATYDLSVGDFQDVEITRVNSIQTPDLNEIDEIEEVVKDGEDHIRLNGPLQNAEILFDCPIEQVNDTEVDPYKSGARVYVNSQPVSIRELRDGYTEEECEPEGEQFIRGVPSNFRTTGEMQEFSGSSVSEAGDLITFIQEGQKVEIGSDSLTFTDINEGITLNTWFRTGVSLSEATTSDCIPDGKTAKMRPLNAFPGFDVGECSFKKEMMFESGNADVAVCTYDDEFEIAKVLITSSITGKEQAMQKCEQTNNVVQTFQEAVESSSSTSS